MEGQGGNGAMFTLGEPNPPREEVGPILTRGIPFPCLPGPPPSWDGNSIYTFLLY